MIITIRTADRGPKAFIAQITGRDARYKFARRFLQLADAGNRLNCYTDKVTVDDVPEGSILQARTVNYKGKATDRFLRVTETDTVKITEADVFAALEG